MVINVTFTEQEVRGQTMSEFNIRRVVDIAVLSKIIVRCDSAIGKVELSAYSDDNYPAGRIFSLTEANIITAAKSELNIS